MKSILNIFQIWYREIGNIFRDKGIMIFILFVPLAYPLLYSYVYTNEVVREVPVAVVDESHSELSRELLRKMGASPDMKIVAYCDNLSAAQEMIRRQEVYGIVRIPSDFTRELWKGSQAPSASTAICRVCFITRRSFLRPPMFRLRSTRTSK